MSDMKCSFFPLLFMMSQLLLSCGCYAQTASVASHRPAQIGPYLIADNYPSLNDALRAAAASGSPILLTCGSSYAVGQTLNIPSGVAIDAACPGSTAKNAGSYPTTISFSGTALIGPANNIALHWVNLAVPNGAKVIMSGIQHSNLDFSATCGTGLSETTTATTARGVSQVTVASTAGIAVGQAVTAGWVSGAAVIPEGTRVAAISGNTITLTNSALSSHSGLSVTLSWDCLNWQGLAADNFVWNTIPHLNITTMSGGALNLNGNTGFVTENNIGLLNVIYPNYAGPAIPVGNAIEFDANCDSNSIAKIGLYYNGVSYGNGIVFNSSSTPTVDTDADEEDIGWLDSTGGVQGMLATVNSSIGNDFTVGVVNFSGTVRANVLTYTSRMLLADPVVNGLHWQPSYDLNKLYRSGSYALFKPLNGPPPAEAFICNIYDAGDAVGASQQLEVQECIDISPNSSSSGKSWRRVSSGAGTWQAWQSTSCKP